MKKNIGIEINLDKSFKYGYRLEISTEKNVVDHILYCKNGVRNCNIFSALQTILGVKAKDYDTLDKAIALWGLEDPRKPKTVWDLKKGDVSYALLGDGDITQTVWEDTKLNYYNEKRREQGNVFLTLEEAKKEVLKRKATTFVKKAIAEYNGDWAPNFTGKQYNFFLNYKHRYNHIEWAETEDFQPLSNDLYIKDTDFPITEEFTENYRLMLGVSDD